jgi:hypothetical protein
MHLKNIPYHSNNDAAAVNAIVNIVMELEWESRVPRIHLPYHDVCKFRNDGLGAGKIPKML